MKHIILTIFLSFISLAIFSQEEYQIKGFVKDTLGNAISGASVMLTTKADSTMVDFSLTNGKGQFAMKGIPEGEYFLQVTFMGYMNHVEYAKIQNKTSNIHEFEDIILREGDTMLEEVLVMEDRIPIMIKKDTIEYNAGSFDVHENALVEELLQELPGVEVAEDGTIKANGKEVKNVLVDGQEFFGSDPKMATQNLPAKAVDKVQVYEKESDEAKFSGMANLDDEETTINLKLKEEYKKGYLGKAEIGGGTDNTFTSRLSLNRFDKKNQISVIGRMNNTTNKSGLTMNESINFAGGISSLMDNIGGDNMVAFNSGSSQHEGLNTIGLLGVNYNWKANPKIKISANYKLDFVKSDLDETKFQENNIANLNYSSIDTLYKDSRSLMNLANLKFKFKPDSTLRVNWTNKIQFNTARMDNTRSNFNFNDEKELTNAQNSSAGSKGNTFELSSQLSIQKKTKSGAIIGSTSRLKGRNNRGRFTNMSETDLYDDSLPISNILLSRQGEDRNPSMELYQKLSFIQPLGKFVKWDNNYSFTYNTKKDNNNLTDKIDDISIKNEELSRDFGLSQIKHTAKTNLQYVREKYQLGIGLKYQNTNLIFSESSNSLYNRPYHFLLPSMNIGFRLKKMSNIRLNYSTNVRMPSLVNLNPTINNNNPSRLYQGNPDLKPEYNHSTRFTFFLFDQFTSISFNSFLSYRKTQNVIIQESIIDNNLIENIRPINSGSASNYNLSMGYGMPLKFMSSRINLNTNTTINISPNNINGITNNYRQFIQNFNTDISNKKKKNWDIKLGYNLNYNSSKNIDENLNLSSFIDHSFSLKTNYRFNNGLRFGNKLKYRTFSNSEQQFLLWDMFVEKTVFKNKKGLIKLSATDILNNNRGINREANGFYSLEKRNNTRGRYLMLSFAYNFTLFEKGKK